MRSNEPVTGGPATAASTGESPATMAAAPPPGAALVAVGYSAEYGRLTATLQLAPHSGYTPDARAYVRFFVDQGDGAGFVLAGLAAALPTGADLPPTARGSTVAYAASVPFNAARTGCASPLLPVVRAVLGAPGQPPALDPGAATAPGHRLDARVQLPPRPLRFSDYLAYLATNGVPLPAWHADVADSDLALIEPPAPTLPQLIQRYRDRPVPAHRYALPHVLGAVHSGSDEVLRGTAGQLAEAGLDWSATLAELFNADADDSYEKLVGMGLDNNTDSLVATLRVRRRWGYGGDPCSAGSSEYVAFWADWADEGVYHYLGTVPVTVHDYPTNRSPGSGPGGLDYAVVLPVRLSTVRGPADPARTSRVRAVLSWGVPPTTTDPYALPYWGDVREAQVRVRPDAPVAGPELTAVAGVPLSAVDPDSGLPRPRTALRGSGLPADPAGRPRPFTGRLPVRGAGLGHHEMYRVMRRDLTRDAAPVPVCTPFVAGTPDGGRISVTPALDGWTQVPASGGESLLGMVEVAEPGLWSVWLETVPPSAPVEYRLRVAPAPTATTPPAAPLPIEARLVAAPMAVMSTVEHEPTGAPEPAEVRVEAAAEPGAEEARELMRIPRQYGGPVNDAVLRASQAVQRRARQLRGHFVSAHEFAAVDRKPRAGRSAEALPGPDSAGAGAAPAGSAGAEPVGAREPVASRPPPGSGTG